MFHVHNDYVETTRPTFQSLKTSGGLTMSGDDAKTSIANISPTFHKDECAPTKFEKVSRQKSGLQKALISALINIHTGWYVGHPQESDT